jgi:hypothetical protein
LFRILKKFVFVLNASSVFIRVHPRPIMSFALKSLANIKSVFICVHLAQLGLFLKIEFLHHRNFTVSVQKG